MGSISKEKKAEYNRNYLAKKKKKAKGYTEVNTSMLEELALELINIDHTDKVAINLLVEIWKNKSKVPTETTLLDIEV